MDATNMVSPQHVPADMDDFVGVIAPLPPQKAKTKSS